MVYYFHVSISSVSQLIVTGAVKRPHTHTHTHLARQFKLDQLPPPKLASPRCPFPVNEDGAAGRQGRDRALRIQSNEGGKDLAGNNDT